MMRSSGSALRRIAASAVWLVVVLSVGAPPVAFGQTSAATPLRGPDLLAALRAGGYILSFRHADTDHSQNDRRMTSVEDCTTQRNLTDRGRDHARALGEAIRTLGIPIGAVLASPLCRTTPVAPGTNAVVVAHAYPYFSLVGGQFLEEGEADVVRPRGGDFEVVARVGLRQWRDLAATR
jgi:Histidine phosphatase superfamily (branch 1)